MNSCHNTQLNSDQPQSWAGCAWSICGRVTTTHCSIVRGRWGDHTTDRRRYAIARVGYIGHQSSRNYILRPMKSFSQRPDGSQSHCPMISNDVRCCSRTMDFGAQKISDERNSSNKCSDHATQPRRTNRTPYGHKRSHAAI